MNLEGATGALRSLAEGNCDVAGEVRLDLGRSVGRIEIDSPGSRNAMTLRMMVQLAEAVERLASWSGNVVVLEATGERVFCSGGHLKDVLSRVRTPDQARTMCLAMGTVLAEWRSLPQWTVTWVQGLALGGGAELAVSGDALFMSPDAKIHFVHGKLGIVPGWGGAGRLEARVGDPIATTILTEATAMNAQRCITLGIAEESCESREAFYRDWVEPRSSLSREALRALKAPQTSATGAASRSLEEEAGVFAQVWLGDAHRAALKARGLA